MALNFLIPGTQSYIGLIPRHNNGLFPSEERLYYYKKRDGGECSIPAMSTQGSKVYAGLDSNGSQVYYDTSSPTIAFVKGGKTYYCAKDVTKEIPADIPAGTYTPSNFKSLVTSFTGSTSGSYRTLANAVSVTVNGQTLSLSSGTKIYFVSLGSSPWHAQAIGFGVNYFQAASCQSGNGFSQYKAYIVLAQPTATVTSDICFNRVFATYEAYNITVSSPGIKFK